MGQIRLPLALCPLPQPSNVCQMPSRPPPEAGGCVGVWALPVVVLLRAPVMCNVQLSTGAYRTSQAEAPM